MAGVVVPLIGNQVAADFTSDALFGGIGAFLVFVPQIFVLTFIIGLLEDSGYMARAALICHKPLRVFGLTGKSFIPMLSGVACAIPAIYAARAIDSPRKRLLTYMAIPLMPCSARLPVYTLLIAAFIPSGTALGGLVGWQGLAMFCIYFFGMFVGLLVTGIVSRMSEDHLHGPALCTGTAALSGSRHSAHCAQCLESSQAFRHQGRENYFHGHAGDLGVGLLPQLRRRPR